MELSEPMTRVLIVLGIAVVGALSWFLRKVERQRRQSWVDRLATAFASRADHEEFRSRFPVEIDGRSFEVAYRHLSSYDRSNIGWRLESAIPLAGVSDIYSLQLRPAGTRAGGDPVVTNMGFQAREGWLDDEVRRTVARFFETAPRPDLLDVEGGRLVYRTTARLDGEALRALVTHQVAVAKALEQTL